MLTDQKARYAEGRVKGMTKRDAAVYAGCPPRTAQNAASRYEKDADVIEAIRRLNHGQDLPPSAPAYGKKAARPAAVAVDRPKAMDLPPLPDLEPLPVTDDPKVWDKLAWLFDRVVKSLGGQATAVMLPKSAGLVAALAQPPV